MNSARRLNGIKKTRVSRSNQAPTIALLAPLQMGHITPWAPVVYRHLRDCAAGCKPLDLSDQE
jgi:hypothetical protein